MTFDPDAPWWVNTVLLLIVALLWWLKDRRTQHLVKGIHAQVTNEHEANLRDEISEGFAKADARFDKVDDRVDGLSTKVTNMGRRLSHHIDGGAA